MRRTENGRCCEGEKRRDEESQSACEAREVGEPRRNRQRERLFVYKKKKEINSNRVKSCVKYDFDRIILTLGN